MTQGAALFGDVTVVLPDSWRHAECAENAEESNGVQTADVAITAGPHPVFGDRPWASQFGGCGERGSRVEISHSSLFPNNENRTSENDIEEAFLKEWIKYRFGVFEERGFATSSESVYPALISEGEFDVPNVGCNDTENEVRNNHLFPSTVRYLFSSTRNEA